MPTRILREGIITSEKIEMLDNATEIFYRRLMSKVDDHGLFDARPSVLRAALYPLRLDKIKESNILNYLESCKNAGLIIIYIASDGKQYLKILNTNWKIRSQPKFPPPTEEQLIANDNNCTHPRPYTETETETNTETNTYRAPTAQDVTDYAKSINFNLDGNIFIDFYTSKNWMIGKNKMKDWKAAVRTWKANQKNGGFTNAKTNGGIAPVPGKYDGIGD